MQRAIVVPVSRTVQASPEWYIGNVLPLMLSSGVVAVAPFSHRLAFNELPDEIQRLRCKVNFEALRFVPTIDHLGNLLVERLRKSRAPNVDGVAVKPKCSALLGIMFPGVDTKYTLATSEELEQFAGKPLNWQLLTIMFLFIAASSFLHRVATCTILWQRITRTGERQ